MQRLINIHSGRQPCNIHGCADNVPSIVSTLTVHYSSLLWTLRPYYHRNLSPSGSYSWQRSEDCWFKCHNWWKLNIIILSEKWCLVMRECFPYWSSNHILLKLKSIVWDSNSPSLAQCELFRHCYTTPILKHTYVMQGLLGTAAYRIPADHLFLDQCGSYIWTSFAITNIHKRVHCLHRRQWL